MEGHGRHTKIGKSFGIGIIGLGEGKGLVKGLHGHPELHIAGICDLNRDLLLEVQRDFQIPNAYQNLEEMVTCPDIDIVVIYTPDQLHLEHIRTCFEAGKHVICTKPLVTSLEEAWQVIGLAQKHSNLRLMVGQSSRFFGSMQRQRKAFEMGKAV